MRSRLLIAWCALWMGCGGADKPDDSTPTPPPPTRDAREAIVLRVALQSEVAGIDTLLTQWSAREGAEVSLEVVSDPLESAEEFALIELDALDLGDAAASGLVREVGDFSDATASHVGGAATTWRSASYGWPWRGRVHGLLLPSGVDALAVSSWSELARLAQRSGGLALLEDDRQAGFFEFLSLSAANGGSFGGEELTLDPAPAVEALAFLARLHGRGPRLRSLAVLQAHVASGGVAASVLIDPKRWSAWPAASGSTAVAVVEPRVLCIPRGAPYLDLAVSLARQLDRALAQLPSRPWHSLQRDRLPKGLYVALPARSGLRRAAAAWAAATTAVLDRRRSPEDALAQAQERWMTAEVHEP